MIWNSKKRRSSRAIRETAAYHGVSEAQCRKDMQEALDEAWETSRQDPATMEAWKKYFPDGQKPTLEDFIERLARKVREKQEKAGV